MKRHFNSLTHADIGQSDDQHPTKKQRLSGRRRKRGSKSGPREAELPHQPTASPAPRSSQPKVQAQPPALDGSILDILEINGQKKKRRRGRRSKVAAAASKQTEAALCNQPSTKHLGAPDSAARAIPAPAGESGVAGSVGRRLLSRVTSTQLIVQPRKGWVDDVGHFSSEAVTAARLEEVAQSATAAACERLTAPVSLLTAEAKCLSQSLQSSVKTAEALEDNIYGVDASDQYSSGLPVHEDISSKAVEKVPESVEEKSIDLSCDINTAREPEHPVDPVKSSPIRLPTAVALVENVSRKSSTAAGESMLLPSICAGLKSQLDGSVKRRFTYDRPRASKVNSVPTTGSRTPQSTFERLNAFVKGGDDESSDNDSENASESGDESASLAGNDVNLKEHARITAAITTPVKDGPRSQEPVPTLARSAKDARCPEHMSADSRDVANTAGGLPSLNRTDFGVEESSRAIESSSASGDEHVHVGPHREKQSSISVDGVDDESDSHTSSGNVTYSQEDGPNLVGDEDEQNTEYATALPERTPPRNFQKGQRQSEQFIRSVSPIHHLSDGPDGVNEESDERRAVVLSSLGLGSYDTAMLGRQPTQARHGDTDMSSDRDHSAGSQLSTGHDIASEDSFYTESSAAAEGVIAAMQSTQEFDLTPVDYMSDAAVDCSRAPLPFSSRQANVGKKRQASFQDYLNSEVDSGPDLADEPFDSGLPAALGTPCSEDEDMERTLDEIENNVFGATRALPSGKPVPPNQDGSGADLTIVPSVHTMMPASVSRRFAAEVLIPTLSPTSTPEVIIYNSLVLPLGKQSNAATPSEPELEFDHSAEGPELPPRNNGGVELPLIAGLRPSSSLSQLGCTPSPPSKMIHEGSQADDNALPLSKKRRMTGLTSKHFSPVKSVKRRRSNKDYLAETSSELRSSFLLDEAVDGTPGSDQAVDAALALELKPGPTKPKRKSTGTKSDHFLPLHLLDRVDLPSPTKRRVPAGTSAAPVPSILSDRFGIIQEKLSEQPFWLLIAVTFLNKTTGRAAVPVFWALKERYSTPEALATADQAELCDMVKHLGLQNQRSKRVIKIAEAWLERPPMAGKRYRAVNYPAHADHKEFNRTKVVDSDAVECKGALEIGHIPGCGAYAWDSWRIFCRDVLRGVANDYRGSQSNDPEFQPEWQRVLPADKELRATLRWMWLKEGWIWDHETGEKRSATDEEMERAVQGEMDMPDTQERKFAAQAAGVETLKSAVVAASPCKPPATGSEHVAEVEERGHEAQVSRDDSEEIVVRSKPRHKRAAESD